MQVEIGPNWLVQQLERGGVRELLSALRQRGARDRRVASILAEAGERSLDTLYEALQLCAPILSERPGELEAQLLGRLPPSESAFDELRARLRERHREDPKLVPELPSLTPPGTPLVATLTGHQRPLHGATLLEGGRQILTWGQDCVVKLWELRSGICLRTFVGHRHEVFGARVLPGRGQLLSWGADGRLKLWELESGERLLTFGDYRCPVEGAVWLETKNQVLSWSLYDGRVDLWSLATGERIRGFEHQEVVGSLIVNDHCLSWGGSKPRVALWELASGKIFDGCFGDSVQVLGVTSDGADGTGVLTSAQGELQLWSVDGLRRLQRFEAAAFDVWRGRLLPSGRVVAWSSEGEFGLWSKDGCLVRAERLVSREFGVCIGEGEQQLWASDADSGELVQWSLSTGECVRVGESGMAYIEPGGNGRLLSHALYGCKLHIWDLQRGPFSQYAELDGEGVRDIEILGESERAVSAHHDGKLRFWCLQTGRCEHELQAHDEKVQRLFVQSAGRRALSCGDAGRLRVWDLEHRRLERELPGHGSWVSCVALLDGGERVATCGADDCLRVTHIDTGQSTCLDREGARVVRVRGQQALAWSSRSGVRLWDLATGKCLRALPAPEHGVQKVLWPRTAQHGSLGSVLVQGVSPWEQPEPAPLEVWDLEQGCRAHSIQPDEKVRGLDLVDGDRAVLLRGDSGSHQLWDWVTGRKLWATPGKDGDGGGLCLEAEGGALTWSWSGELKLWDLRSGVCERIFEGPSRAEREGIGALLWPGGQWLLGCSGDRLSLWDFRSARLLSTLTFDARPQVLRPLGSTRLLVGDKAGNVHFVRIVGGKGPALESHQAQ